MTMKPKNTANIRIYPKEREIWREYCKILGESSPRLFSKVLSSKELNLNQRILNEFKKKEVEVRRRMGHE